MPPAAVIKINGVAASNADLPLNVLVQLDNQNAGGELTYAWTIIDQPPGPADILSSAIIQNPTFTPKKEGTYLIKLVVNQTLPTEVSNTKIAGILQLKTRQRVPAAGETIEPGVRGWADPAGAFLQLVDAARADPGILVGVAGAAGLIVGNTVRTTSKQTIKAGLPGQEVLPGFTLGTALLAANIDEMLGIVEGAVDGSAGPFAINKLLKIRTAGPVYGTAGVPVAVGDPVFVSDTGLLALAAGTNTKLAGSVMSFGGGTFDTWFNGGLTTPSVLSAVAPVDVTKAAAVAGVSLLGSKADHKHDISTAAAATQTTSGANAEGAAASLARSDHAHAINVSQQNVGASGLSNVTSANPIFAQLAAGVFELALAIGTYYIAMSCRFTNNTNNGVSFFQLQTGSSFLLSAAVANSQRYTRASAANAEGSIDIGIVLVVGAATNLYVGVSSTLGSTVGVLDRTLTALRLS